MEKEEDVLHHSVDLPSTPAVDPPSGQHGPYSMSLAWLEYKLDIQIISPYCRPLSPSKIVTDISRIVFVQSDVQTIMWVYQCNYRWVQEHRRRNASSQSITNLRFFMPSMISTVGVPQSASIQPISRPSLLVHTSPWLLQFCS